MKMRKFVALLATMCVSSSLFVANVSAEITTTKPTLVATSAKMTNEDFVSYYDEDIPAGKEAWTVAFEVEDITDSLMYTKTAGTNAKPKYSGIALDVFEIFLRTDDTAVLDKFDKDYSYVIDNALNVAVTEGFTTDGYTINFNGNFVYPAAKDTEGITDGSTSGFITMCFLIDEGTTVDFTLSDGTIQLIEYTDGTINSAPEYNTRVGSLGLKNNTVTIGSSTPAGPVGTEIATGVYYAGNVDTTTTTLTDDTTFSISYDGGEPKVIAQTLAQILGGEGIAGNLTGKLHFAIKPVSVEASTLEFSKFVINVN